MLNFKTKKNIRTSVFVVNIWEHLTNLRKSENIWENFGNREKKKMRTSQQLLGNIKNNNISEIVDNVIKYNKKWAHMKTSENNMRKSETNENI